MNLARRMYDRSLSSVPSDLGGSSSWTPNPVDAVEEACRASPVHSRTAPNVFERGNLHEESPGRWRCSAPHETVQHYPLECPSAGPLPRSLAGRGQLCAACGGGRGTFKLAVTKAKLFWNLRVAVLIGQNGLDKPPETDWHPQILRTKRISCPLGTPVARSQSAPHQRPNIAEKLTHG